MTFLKSIFAGLVVLALAMLAKPLLVRALQLNAGGGTTPPFPPPRSRPAGAPLTMPRYDPATPAGRRQLPAEEPEDMLDAVINVRRVEGRINAATTRRVAELLQRHPDLAAQAMRRWLAQRDDSR